MKIYQRNTKFIHTVMAMGLIGVLFFSFTGIEEKASKAPMIYDQWEVFTTSDGLPSNKVFCVKVDGDRVWAGTDEGLALYEGGKWTTYTTEDGLAHRGVLSIDISPVTGDVWIATMSGLNRFSAGKFETFTQFNSGLANDVIYNVTCVG